ncbi:ABC transporter permease [Paenibacillus sp. NPDC058071]|uniref:ABC transporter permease n=1 Tax=Paenibacillus sp. NPDC058071 TaxID=3346326 RepID=UPI0036D81E34
MRQWLILCRKEWLELVRSYKLIWVPLVFVLLGVSQPVSLYFLPELLAAAGNMPEEAIINIPVPQGGEVLAQTLQQFGIIGSLIIALAFMGAISGERNSGTAALILAKPVSRSAFVLAKWSMMLLLVWLSLGLGFLGSWYYTEALIGSVAAASALKGLLVYGVWLSLVGTLAVAASSWWRSGAAAAFTALGVAGLLSLASSFFSKALAWSPGRLPSIAAEIIMEISGGVESAAALGSCGAFSALLLASAVWRLRKTEFE